MRTARAVAELSVTGTPEPDEQQYELIRPYLLTAVPPAALYVRPVVLCNDALDRSDTWMPEAYLSRGAQTLPGKPLLLDHDDRQITGLWYQAQVRPARPGEEGSLSLEAWFYLLREPNAALIAQIDAGIVRYASAGFKYDKLVCDICQMEYWGGCNHFRGQVLEDGRRVTMHWGGDPERAEFYEGSLVSLGRQRGAGIARYSRKETAMDEKELKEALAARDARIDALVAQVAELTKETPAPAPAPTVIDTAVAALVADGKAYRTHQREEIVRLAKLVGLEAQAQLMLASAPDAKATDLESVRLSYQTLVDEKHPVPPIGELPAGSEQEQSVRSGRTVRAL